MNCELPSFYGMFWLLIKETYLLEILASIQRSRQTRCIYLSTLFSLEDIDLEMLFINSLKTNLTNDKY